MSWKAPCGRWRREEGLAVSVSGTDRLPSREDADTGLAGLGRLRGSVIRSWIRREVPLQGERVIYGVERRAGGQAARGKRQQLRRDFPLERCGGDGGHDRPRRITGPDEDSELFATATVSDITAAGEGRGEGVWGAIPMGAQPAAV